MTGPVRTGLPRVELSSTVIVPATARHPRNDEATAVVLNDGRVLLAWSRFHGLNRRSDGPRRHDHPSGLPGEDLESDNAASDIAGMVSSDCGQTWNEPVTIVPNEAGLNVMNPSLARLANGRLGLVYNHRESTTRAFRMFRSSLDEGATWSDPVPLNADGYVTGCNDRLLVLASGRIVAPIHSTKDWHAHHLETRVAWSDDHGSTWRTGEPLRLPKVEGSGESGCWEPDVAQRADGTLLMVMRTAMGTVFRADSQDEGATWSGLRSLEVVAPVAPAIVRRIPGGAALLLVWNWHYDWREPMGGVRRPLALAVSHDGGASWPLAQRRVLEDDPDCTYAYPSCTFLKDVMLITFYVSAADDPFGARSLKVARVPIAYVDAIGPFRCDSN